MRTHRDLVDAVLVELGVLTPGNAGSPEDLATVSAIADEVIPMLAKRNINDWPRDDIPDFIFRSLVRFVTVYAAPAYGGPSPSEETIDALIDRIERESQSKYYGFLLRTDFPFNRRHWTI